MGVISKSNDGMEGTRSLSAFYTSRAAADAARTALVDAGLSFEAVKITDGRGTITGRSAAAEPSAGGPVDTLQNAFAQDRPSMEAEAARPGHVLTAHVPAALHEQAAAIIARDGEIAEEA